MTGQHDDRDLRAAEEAFGAALADLTAAAPPSRLSPLSVIAAAKREQRAGRIRARNWVLGLGAAALVGVTAVAVWPGERTVDTAAMEAVPASVAASVVAEEPADAPVESGLEEPAAESGTADTGSAEEQHSSLPASAGSAADEEVPASAGGAVSCRFVTVVAELADPAGAAASECAAEVTSGAPDPTPGRPTAGPTDGPDRQTTSSSGPSERAVLTLDVPVSPASQAGGNLKLTVTTRAYAADMSADGGFTGYDDSGKGIWSTGGVIRTINSGAEVAVEVAMPDGSIVVLRAVAPADPGQRAALAAWLVDVAEQALAEVTGR